MVIRLPEEYLYKYTKYSVSDKEEGCYLTIKPLFFIYVEKYQE